MKNPNFLILDEPTNDLDIMTLNVLEDFLLDFPGCVLIVSHDRFFLDKLAHHLFIFEGQGEIRDWNGLYSEYREEIGRQLPSESAAPVAIAPAAAPRKETTEKQLSQEERKAIRRVEGQIGKLESRKAELNQQFNNMAALTPEKIAELGKELAEVNEAIEEKELEWMELVGE
jgi:ATP-binding cassette subfamily F protein uup